MSEIVKRGWVARHESLLENLRQRFAAEGFEAILELGEVTLVVPAEQLQEVALELRDGDAYCFEQLIDMCGIDYAHYGRSEWATGNASFTGFGRGVDAGAMGADNPGVKRFAVVYHLLSVSLNQRLRVRAYVDEAHPVVDSVTDIWSCADWYEREAFDLYGILFNGHRDLRRILTDYGFVGHPFRKDFPLHGQVEMRYDMEKGRVVYEPVSIQPRTLIPKVIREDNRYQGDENKPQDPVDA